MFGIETSELYAFILQLGLALAGAAALWGLVFSLKARSTKSNVSHIIYHWTAQRLKYLLYASALIAVTGWILVSRWLTTHTHAHEGIRLAPNIVEQSDAISYITPVMLTWIFVVLITALVHIYKRDIFHRYLPALFTLHFAFVVFLISFSSAWTGEFSDEKLFFVLHNIHSIFTVGTVLVLDYLFLSAKSSYPLQRHIIPFFPWISKVIWIGLGMDFLSVALIFPEAVAYTPTFFFAQTVVGILIVNGVLLAGPITRKMLESLTHGVESMHWRWLLVADIAGAISITSWVTITFVDFFKNLTLDYAEMLGIYASIIIIGVAGHGLWQWLDRDAPLLPYEEEQSLHPNSSRE